MRSIFLFLILTGATQAADTCAKIKTCAVVKTTYKSKGWTKDIKQEMKPVDLCLNKTDKSHLLKLEPNLGVALEVFSGNPKSENPIENRPWILVDVFTYKLTEVVASAKASVDASQINFSHRLGSKTFIEVTCY